MTMFKFRRILLVMSAVALLAAPIYYTANLEDAARAGGIEVGVEINRHGAEPSYIPVAGGTSGRYTVLTVPDGAGDEKAAPRVFGVKLSPKLEGDAVKIEVSVLSGSFGREVTCQQVKALDQKLVAEYRVRRGESVRVTQFEYIGIAPFEIKVVAARAEGGSACCTVGGLTCCLSPGQECVRCNRQLCCV
jgi:hypothetical protein